MNAERRATPNTVSLVLHRCLEACFDGSLGYAEAADQVADAKLGDVLRDHAKEQRRFAGELRAVLGELEMSSPDRGAGSLPGASLSNVATEKTDTLALAECARRDRRTLDAYEQAFVDVQMNRVPGIVGRLIQEHYVAVRERLDLVQTRRPKTLPKSLPSR